jgi:RNA polymerase sigma-70 factor (ECF subfamily)
MLRSGEGDEEAFTELVRRHQRSVLNLVRRFVGPIPDQEDLAQEIFVRLYQARTKYRPTAKFTTYLYRNTLNLCLNYIRDRKVRRTLPLDPGGEDGAGAMEMEDSAVEGPGAVAARRETSRTVRDAVAALPDNQRTALVLSRWHGASYQDIADTMELSVMAVKSLLSRAKENLRSRLSILLRDDDRVREDG